MAYYFDDEFGRHQLRAREYDPAAARFQSKDPSGFVDEEFNLYRYVANDPTNASDPSGLDAGAAVRSLPLGELPGEFQAILLELPGAAREIEQDPRRMAQLLRRTIPLLPHVALLTSTPVPPVPPAVMAEAGLAHQRSQDREAQAMEAEAPERGKADTHTPHACTLHALLLPASPWSFGVPKEWMGVCRCLLSSECRCRLKGWMGVCLCRLYADDRAGLESQGVAGLVHAGTGGRWSTSQGKRW